MSGGVVQTTYDADPSPAVGGEADAAPSHLDSFFADSRWTREDVQVLAALWSALILTLWATGYLEPA